MIAPQKSPREPQQTAHPAVLPLADPTARLRGATLAAAGHPIGLFLGGLCVALGDGSNQGIYDWTTRSKGEGRIGRPMAALLPAHELVPMIDPREIPPALRHILLNAEELVTRLGALVFVRLPVREAVAGALPPWLLSRGAGGTPLFQFMDPTGYGPMALFIEAMRERGIRYPAGSSMNVSGHPELVRREDGIAFAGRTGIPLFLEDGASPIGLTGSYPILHIERGGLHLVREGPVPGWAYEHLLEHPVDRSAAQPAKYPQLALRPAELAGLPPAAVREAILARMQGRPSSRTRTATGGDPRP